MEQQIISTNKANISLTTDGHILINIHEGQDIELNDIVSINELKNKFAGNKMYTVIFVAPDLGNISREAREYSSSKKVYKNAIAKAIVVKSLSARIISSFFIAVNKPPAKTQLFKNEEDAALWLNKIRSDYNTQKS